MSFDKKELKHLVTELKKMFASKAELEALRDVINEDLAEFDPNITYVGSEEPENIDAIWFDDGEADVDEIVYDNPIINELFGCINTLQNQIYQLQADVEYLKINGGGSGGGVRPPADDDDNENDDIIANESFMILEDGGMFLLEDGSYLLLEASEKVINDSALALESGGLFMLENGGYMILENTIESISKSLIMLENGGKMLLENGGSVLLEK